MDFRSKSEKNYIVICTSKPHSTNATLMGLDLHITNQTWNPMRHAASLEL